MLFKEKSIYVMMDYFENIGDLGKNKDFLKDETLQLTNVGEIASTPSLQRRSNNAFARGVGLDMGFGSPWQGMGDNYDLDFHVKIRKAFLKIAQEIVLWYLIHIPN